MLEIAILVCVAAIFIILTVRFPKTHDLVFPEKVGKAEVKSILEAKKILGERHIKKQQIVEEGISEVAGPVDELDRYDKELAGLLKLARDKIESGKYASAENLLIDAICKDSKCAWAYERLGTIYLVMGKNYPDAKESFLMALKLDKYNAPAWSGLGQIYFHQSKFNKAIASFQKAVNLSRATAQYQAALGKAYLEVRQYGRAAKALKRAASLDISNQEYKDLASMAEDKHREHSKASNLS